MRAVLISIREKHWNNIKSGKKKKELRKTVPKQIEDTFTAYVYVPEQKAICGQFFVPAVTPVQPSEELEQTACISIDEQIKYKGEGMLYGWQIKLPVEYTRKFNLMELMGIARPPQSWQYCELITTEDRAKEKRKEKCYGSCS